MQKYIVWYKTRSGNYSREIPFKSLERAKPLFNALERDFKYLSRCYFYTQKQSEKENKYEK